MALSNLYSWYFSAFFVIRKMHNGEPVLVGGKAKTGHDYDFIIDNWNFWEAAQPGAVSVCGGFFSGVATAQFCRKRLHETTYLYSVVKSLHFHIWGNLAKGWREWPYGAILCDFSV